MTQSNSTPDLLIERIRFVDAVPAGATVLRVFPPPHAATAVVEAAAVADLPHHAPWPEPTVELTIVFVAPQGESVWESHAADWLKPPEQPDAPRAIEVSKQGLRVEWRPGRAVVRAGREQWSDVRDALTDFAWYEGQLRDLELELASHAAAAREDVPRAHNIQYGDRSHWPRYSQLIEHFTKVRLNYSQLEPRLLAPSRGLSAATRGLFKRLVERAETETRLEAASDQLENYEFLYEDANDRVHDYQWYRWGTLLEVLIVVLLMTEVVLVGTELYFTFLDHIRE